jgi:hypothetical protein
VTDFLPPGNTPAWADSDAANQIAQIWQGEMWPELWPKMVFTYANAAARDADLAGLGPADVAFAWLVDVAELTVWKGSAWGYVQQRHYSNKVSSFTTDANGYKTITHNAPFTPNTVVAQLFGAFQWQVDTITSTTFRLRLLNSDGTPANAVTTGVYFTCAETP